VGVLSYLNHINDPADISGLSISQLGELATECREFLIETILENGGHFAGNLGVVELTVALLAVFDTTSDRIVWDVGHQSYVYKTLTGRRDSLHTIRNYEGISGFPKLGENNADHFGTGHSSTAISAALGMAMAARLKNETGKNHIAIVGDGALSGGMAFEALNNAAALQPNLLIIINDNQISIDPSTGAINEHLANITNQSSNIFTNLNLAYHGPIDGHDINALLDALHRLKSEQGARVLHVKTIKGKGFPAAEAEQTKWHSTTKYTKISTEKQSALPKWHEVAGDTMFAIASQNQSVVGITPAMPSGSGLVNCFKEMPSQFFDVGIAEQHAVTFAAGLATSGIKPYLFIYSTFLQRGYDQAIHDVALQQLPVVFCIDRAGLVGEDGPTHHGAFDIPMLRCIPNIKLLAPATKTELEAMMQMAQHHPYPLAIRYPKGSIPEWSWDFEVDTILDHPGVCLTEGNTTAILTTGHATHLAAEAIKLVPNHAAHYHFPVINPHKPTQLLPLIANNFRHIITVEDGAIKGGFGEALFRDLYALGYKGSIHHLGIPDHFITHGNNRLLYRDCGYSPERISQVLKSLNQ
jgi:1-deoxy-D-xylulose-5-phosphate synthase